MIALLAGVVSTAGATAQTPDFLFEQPTATLGIRLGYAVPRAGSEIFDFTRQELTLNKSDFNAVSVAAEASLRATDRLSAVLSVEGQWSSARSEFRDFVGTDNLPIEQETKLTRVPVTVGVKAYLVEPGRRISQFAWIPNKLAPYVGAGGGIVWYKFEQTGDFVDFDTLDIFTDNFQSQGVSPLAYLATGLDVAIGPRWFLNGEARYFWANAAMDRDFVGFDDIDLTGFRASVGVSVRL